MKILVTLNYYYPYVSGVSEYARIVAEKMVANGHDVYVITSNHDHLPEYEEINGVKVYRAPIFAKIGKGTLSVKYISWIKKMAKHVDVVNLHIPMLESGLISLLIPSNKIVSMYHCDINLPKSFINTIIVKIMDFSHKIALKRSKFVIVTSLDYGMHSRVAHSFSNKMVEASAPAKDYYNANESFSHPSKPTIGFCGRIVEEKGIDVLLRAYSLIRKKGFDCNLVIGGDYKKVAGGSIYNQLQEIIQKESIDGVRFLGMVPDDKMGEFYKSLDVFVLPSINSLEAYGMVQMEAMLCGTPVVATDLYGVRTIVQKTGMGVVVKKNDELSLADGIMEVLNNKEKYIVDRSKIFSTVGTQKCVHVYEQCFKECVESK